MELLICGRSPLISQSHPAACERRNKSFSNHCEHVPSGEVCADDEENKVCPLTPLSPVGVLSGREKIEIIHTDAQNILKVSADDSQTACHFLWTGDGWLNIDTTLGKMLLSTNDEDIEVQDMWFIPQLPDPNDPGDFGLFDDDLEPPHLGLLARNGSIFSIQQRPPLLTELTTRSNRRPFLHAIFRRELTNYKGDSWSAVVFPAHPRTVYRLPTVHDLISWLSGNAIKHWAITFPSQVTKLLSCGGTDSPECLVLTADGVVYRFGRAWSGGPFWESTFQDALLRQEANGIELPLTTSEPAANNYRGLAGYSPLQRLSLPPVAHLVAGPTIGAAISAEGALYLFLTRPLKKRPHLKDLDAGESDPLSAVAPFCPRPASVGSTTGKDDGTGHSNIIDVAVGYEHIVALTADGRVYTAGDGMQGQLGVGYKQFSLQAQNTSMSDAEEALEFAEEWQEVPLTVERIDPGRKVIGVGAGWESTLLLVSARER